MELLRSCVFLASPKSSQSSQQKAPTPTTTEAKSKLTFSPTKSSKLRKKTLSTAARLSQLRVPPFCNRGPAPSARLVFGSAPLRAPSRTCSKGACPLAFPPPRPVRGTRETVLARSQGNHSPEKRPPPFFTFDPRARDGGGAIRAGGQR